MNWDILYKYMRNACSEKEMQDLQYWLQKNPANEDFFKTFIESWEEKTPPGFEKDVQKVWKKFKTNRLKKETPPQHTIHKKEYKKHLQLSKNARLSRRGHLIWMYATTAIVVLAITIIAVINQPQRKTEKEVPGITYKTIHTKKGQRTNLHLKDGTQIILNAESNLRIPDHYGKTSRIVYLQGEAFFKVTHDADLPFLVISNTRYIKDLGTEFNITAYDSSDIEVAVKEGMVSLGNIKNGKPQQKIEALHKNNLGIFAGTDKVTISTINNINVFSGWSEGKLVFKNTPFRKVVKRLERWFNVNGKIEDSALNNRTLTATYDNMPFDEILDVLSLSMHISYKRDGDTVIFNDKK